jgi:hypothetical protein
MSFAYYDAASIQFGVCRGPLYSGENAVVPVDDSVKVLLEQMVLATRAGMGMDSGRVNLPLYEPSQDYSLDSTLTLSLRSPLASHLRSFYQRENWPIDGGALEAPQGITAYFCIIHDQDGNKLVAIRRASAFKAVLKSHLIRLVNDSLQAMTDDVFKLDSDFDLLIVDSTIYIHRIAGFEHLAEIEDQVQAAAVENAKELGRSLPYLDFDGIAEYVAGHKRAARIVAALRMRDDLSSTSITNLKRECRRSGVLVKTVDGKLCPEKDSEMAFLQMLDRRRYAVSLVPGRWEQYEASSRKGVGVREGETKD